MPLMTKWRYSRLEDDLECGSMSGDAEKNGDATAGAADASPEHIYTNHEVFAFDKDSDKTMEFIDFRLQTVHDTNAGGLHDKTDELNASVCETLCDACKQARTETSEDDSIYEIPNPDAACDAVSVESENIYDAVAGAASADSDVSWSDSEFESYSDDGSTTHREALDLSTKKLPNSTVFNSESSVLQRIRNNLRTKPVVDDAINDSVFVPVTICDDKHPAPSLPPAPTGLSPNQTKRRHVVDSIIQSEQSYVRSLQFILDVSEPNTANT